MSIYSFTTGRRIRSATAAEIAACVGGIGPCGFTRFEGASCAVVAAGILASDAAVNRYRAILGA